ncbi:transposase (putative), gypsy type [Artemisia annua]|uniref:Transposase (Putative), gypsy type n=1 Tax=Artemisia annua TaxID=35608 RepID=A0A2U1QKF9_ARTAN|nr:transposase (putative), gypsy type [Artemisia annua]
MSESSSVGQASVTVPDDQGKFDIQSKVSKTRPSDVIALIASFGIPKDLHPRVPPKGMTMDQLPEDAIGLYVEYFFEGGLNVPFSTFLLDVIKHFKVHISQLVPLGLHRVTLFEVYCRSLHIPPTTSLFRVFYKLCKQGCWFSFEKRTGRNRKGWKEEFFLIDRRAIPFAMPWRHRDSDVSNPFPTGDFVVSHAESLAETILEPFNFPHDFLYMLGLSTYWKYPGFRAELVDEEGRVVTMADYLKKPSIRKNVNRAKGDKLREGEEPVMHLTKPLPSNADVPAKSAELQKVELPSDKVLAAKDRKKEKADRAGQKKPSASGSVKRSGDDLSSRLHKRIRKVTPVVDLETGEEVPTPTPIRSYPPKVPTSAVEGGGSSHAGAGGSRTEGKEGDDEDVDVDTDSSDEAFIPEWSVKQGARMNCASVCRDMLVHLATPAEERHLDAHDNNEVLARSWLLLGKTATAHADILFRFENTLDDYHKLASTHQECNRRTLEGSEKLKKVEEALERLQFDHSGCAAGEPEELTRLRSEHAGCSERELSLTGRVSDLTREKEEWRNVSADQAERIKSLEVELEKVKSELKNEEVANQELRKEYQDLAISSGHVSIDRAKIVKEFVSEVVRRLLGSHEFKDALSKPFNLFYQSGLIDGAHLGLEPEDAGKVLDGVEGLDLEADQKYQVLYDRALTTEYLYIQKISRTYFESTEELMQIFPDPAPTESTTTPTIDASCAGASGSGASRADPNLGLASVEPGSGGQVDGGGPVVQPDGSSA